MVTKYCSFYSNYLNRNMEYKIYGNGRTVFFYFPSQFKRFYEAEDEGVIDVLSPLIDENKIMVVACDNIDFESLSQYDNWDKKARLRKQEAYFNYFIFELYEHIKEEYGYNELPVCFGMSFGAYQAMNIFLRKPQLFQGVFAMSGIYSISFFINDYYDDIAYLNSPIDSVRCLNNQEYLKMYQDKKIVMVVSNGAYEEESYRQTKMLEDAFYQKNIGCYCYYWTSNYPHDWCSWKVYLNYYLNIFI